MPTKSKPKSAKLRAAKRLLHCPTCGHGLILAAHLWVCPAGLHSKGLPRGLVRQRLADLLGVAEGRRYARVHRRSVLAQLRGGQ